MIDITLPIKGREWKFVLLPDRRFNTLHNANDEGHMAMTVPSTHEVHFRKSDWCVSAIRHELLHVLYSMSLVGSTDMTPGDVQELCAEIVAEHAIEIIFWSDRVSERFLRRD